MYQNCPTSITFKLLLVDIEKSIGLFISLAHIGPNDFISQVPLTDYSLRSFIIRVLFETLITKTGLKWSF